MDDTTATIAEEPVLRLEDETEAVIADLEQEFAFLFQSIRLRWKESAHELHPDLSPTAYKILTALTWGGPSTATHLSEILHLDKSAVSRQVATLKQLAMIECHVDEHDARIRSLAASPTAIRLIQAQRRSRANQLRRDLGTWPPEDLHTLVALLRRLTDLAWSLTR